MPYTKVVAILDWMEDNFLHDSFLVQLVLYHDLKEQSWKHSVPNHSTEQSSGQTQTDGIQP